jgi:hypothetical protein
MPEAPPAQPPEGLRRLIVDAIDDAECPHIAEYHAEHGISIDACLSCRADAVLAALSDACAVEEEWMVMIEGNGGSIILPTYSSRAKAVNVARSYGGAATVRRRLTLTWTDEPTLRVTAGTADQQTRT